MIELEPAMIYRLDVIGPAEAVDGSAANPRRQFWQMTRATLEGRNIGDRVRRISASVKKRWLKAVER